MGGGEERKENKLLGPVRFVRHIDDENPPFLPKKTSGNLLEGGQHGYYGMIMMEIKL